MGIKFSLRKWIHLQCFTKEVISEKVISEIQPEVIGGFRDLKAVDQEKVEEVLEEVKSAKIKTRTSSYATNHLSVDDPGEKASEDVGKEFLNSIWEETVHSSRSFLHYKCKDIGLGLILQLRYSKGTKGL
jgi:hypothetical protein